MKYNNPNFKWTNSKRISDSRKLRGEGISGERSLVFITRRCDWIGLSLILREILLICWINRSTEKA